MYFSHSINVDTQKSPSSAIPMNNFNNDGSFLENFMKLSEQMEANMKSMDEESEKFSQFSVPPPAFAGNIPPTNVNNVTFNPHVPPPPPESTSTTTNNTMAATSGVPLLPELDIRNTKG